MYPGLTWSNWQWRSIENKILWQIGWFQLPICSFSMYRPSSRVVGVFIFKLIWYSSACISYHNFFDRWILLTNQLIEQPRVSRDKLKQFFWKCYGRLLWNICVTDNQGYVPIVVTTNTSSFLRLCMFASFHVRKVHAEIYFYGLNTFIVIEWNFLRVYFLWNDTINDCCTYVCCPID